MKTSEIFSLDWRDAIKGLLVSVITSVFTIIENTIQAGSLTFNWKNIGFAALAAGMAYLSKNFLTPSVTVAPTNPVAK